MKAPYLTLVLGSILASSCAFATSADREKPIEVYAHRFQGDEIHQKATYVGAVEVHQGTLEILGDKLDIDIDRDGYRTVTITGSPVRMKEKRDNTTGLDEWVHASANHAVYRERKNLIVFSKNAKLARSENGVVKDTTTGEILTYDLIRATTKISGGVVNGKRGRVSTVFAARSKKSPATKKEQSQNTSDQNSLSLGQSINLE